MCATGMVWAALAAAALLHAAAPVKVKVVMHSEQDDSKPEEEEAAAAAGARSEPPEHRRKEATLLPFLRHAHTKAPRPAAAAADDKPEYEEEKSSDKPARAMHPNEMIFPLIYHQNHINSMFKFGENWYTWSTEKRTDGSKATNYYICYDEPKHCDDIGWERTDTLPKCAFQIDSLLPDDRACINSFGVESHTAGGVCDGAEQMKVSDMVHSCGPRIRSLWRFFRVGRRPAHVAKPADVNSLICEDEEECYITIEYRIHHDRITFSLHEPTRGQTFKSALKRDNAAEEAPPTTEAAAARARGRKIAKHADDDLPKPPPKKFHTRAHVKAVEGKGVVKEHNDSGYRHPLKNKIKVREDISEDVSE